MKIIKIKLFIAVMILLVFTGSNYPFGKVGTTSFQFLKVLPGARANALSGAFSTVVDNSEAVFWNPAGLARIGFFDVSAGYIDWFLDVKHFSFSAGYNLGDFGVLGFQGIVTDIGDIEVTTVERLGFVNGIYNPGLTGEVIRPSSLVLGISYAKNLTDKFAFGITAKFVRENLVFENASALVFDGGLTFNSGYKSIVIGASVRHFGQEVKFIDKSYPLPQTFNIGISSYLISPNDPLITSFENQSVLLSFDLVQPRDYEQMQSVGLEYGYNDMIYLRGGYSFNSDQEKFSAGIGVKYENVRVDYSFNDYGDYLDSVHRMTIGFEIK